MTTGGGETATGGWDVGSGGREASPAVGTWAPANIGRATRGGSREVGGEHNRSESFFCVTDCIGG
jgi:hypothetical protein